MKQNCDIREPVWLRPEKFIIRSKLFFTGLLVFTSVFGTRAQLTNCEPPFEPTFTVQLPKLGTPPDEEGQGWSRPAVWDGHPGATDDSITVPNGRPIYALIVSGYGSNKYFDQLMVYNFARYLMAHGAYVHYAWWNNLLAPYMERPLHYSQSEPGGVSGNITDFLTADSAAGKAVPGEDYQFVADAKKFLTAIRQHNPSAMIIVVGHSMGGGAVVHLGSQTGELIDLLAPIDAVGNRNYPWSGPAALVPPVQEFANWTRWRVTRANFLGFRSAEFGGIGTGCVPTGLWLKDRTEISNDVLCIGMVFYHDAPTLRFGPNIINLHYRYQKEFLFPFDYDQDYLFNHTAPSGGTTSQGAVGMTPEFCGGLQRCPDPGGWPNVLNLSSPCCETGDGVGWPRDGHGEIIGYRGPITDGGPVPLGVMVRTSPQCGSCPNQTWPARSDSGGTWVDPNRADRVQALKSLELLPIVTPWTHRPVNPNLCLVSPGLIQKFEAINKPPVANAGPDQQIECGGPGGTMVTLDGSGSNDPDGDSLTYQWTWGLGNATGVSPTIVLPRGMHCITLTIRDPSGHTARDYVSVTVQDTTPPDLIVALTPRILWPPNHKFTTIQAKVRASDGCGTVTNLTLLRIVSSDRDNGKGDGNTTGDIANATLNTLDLCFDLRAERSGTGRDRIYTVTYQATDDSGNQAKVSQDVVVPHDANSYKKWLQPPPDPKPSKNTSAKVVRVR